MNSPKTISRWVGLGLFFLSLLPLGNLLNSGLPVTHDGKDHVARIANFYQSLAEGNVVPRWSGNLNWGYGHPVTMFLYPMPSYMASGFHALNFSLIDSTKLVFAATFVVSILAMYLFASYAWGVWPGVAAAVLYGFAPYRFVDLYVRGALGEHVAFMFVPIVLLGIWKLARETNVSVGAVGLTGFGMAGLILSHNAISLMMLPVLCVASVYAGIYISKKRLRFFSILTIALMTGFLTSAFFWIPAVFEGKYTLRDIVTTGVALLRFVPLEAFFNPSWSYGGSETLSKFLGFAQLVGIALSVVWVSGANVKIQFFVIGLYIMILWSLFLMTEWSWPIWLRVTLIQKFQFPWRFLSVVTVLAPLAIAATLSTVGSQLQKKFAIFLCLVAVVGTAYMWKAQEYEVFPEGYFSGVYHGTTDTGESAPIWSVRFMEHEASGPLEIISGTGQIEVSARTSTSHEYKVYAESPMQLVENTLYFPGWNIFIDGNAAPIEFQNPNYRGLMTFAVESGTHIVEVRFAQTRLRKYADTISAAAGVSFILFLGTMAVWRPKKPPFQLL